ncbi:hypothetical protein PR202_ga27417 [Eleusine coracana subsp. coracana]|uniref:Uncharacterized protein n=1 Tax=Eleusine coracana subsp. coracana TaxID=191504 RepID=A0AAV5DGM9_ELECO|nr:hypothetical protein PR202_ga27417 [Eleusine coracana subsp. coracana]
MKVFSTSEFCVSEVDSPSAASLIAAASSDFFSASSLCFSARWKAGGSAPPSNPPDSSLLCYSISHKVHEQNVRHLYFYACKGSLQTSLKALKQALDYFHQPLPKILQSRSAS